jgi:hypothetical protein
MGEPSVRLSIDGTLILAKAQKVDVNLLDYLSRPSSIGLLMARLMR